MKPNNDFYEKVHPEYYEELPQKSLNPIRRWFHKKRYEILNNLVKENYQEGKIIVDMGCGSSAWNKNKLPVIGVDINKAMLEHAKQKGNLKEYICVNLENITLTDNFADIVILSEIIEHVEDPQKVLEEATRIAKPNAKIIISVPYDSPLSLWYPLFNIQCLVYGYLLSKPFYKDFGGHIHHFTPGKIKQVIEKTKLKVIKQFHNKRFTIYTICTK
ncbi:MAG: type 11 methyltransferase [archaeon GW2011_AR17]|nr:MAG: type 11 methyltransferase [archaeon GW2011_AR17]MBS3154130.1 class I SAM-dependent methyltransferase [Candidatus Woesearchaeota archaeon]HIH14725.1 class I SAM-dependent methyltransferase [Nanoarchaeota archaeon]HIH59016.1 class I SAM-dependent methyltransferase [Nanoarchaeota archaeon]HII14404.1 class I SAM-dependent methyltransferase [Nanoarchaeota archaeon]